MVMVTVYIKDSGKFMVSKNSTQQEKIRVAIVVPKYGLVGGGERFSSKITGHLALNENFDFHVFANRWISNSNLVTFHRIPIIHFPRFLRPLAFAVLAQRMIDKSGFHIVHSHERIFRADVFSVHCTPHACWVRDVRKKRPSLFDRSVMQIEKKMIKENSSSCFMPVSSIAQNAFTQEYSQLPGKWRILHPGVDIEKFPLSQRKDCRRTIRQRHGIRDTDFLILFVGMNFEIKGLDTIITAVAKARSLRPEASIRLLVVGKGNQKKFGEFARACGIADAITFAGTLSTSIENYFQAADIFTMLSVFDTFGMVVLEAMASCLPVIVSSNVGAKDLIKDGINGFVISHGPDPDATAERIVHLLDKRSREQMGIEARNTSEAHSWDRLAKQVSEVYNEILLQKGGY
ncbi:MAG: putative glycosyltransferase EpsD [Syntrophus sp. PtaB.Bin138]|nr:MAG: putative glycosyltransferase EpsD [Syntrophus sp. PtaB.Bin138]